MVFRAGGGGHLQLVVVVTGAELQPVEHHDHLTQTGSGDEVAVVVHRRHRLARVCGCVVRLCSVSLEANLTDSGRKSGKGTDQPTDQSDGQR